MARRMWLRRLLREPRFVAGAILMLIVIAMALTSRFASPHDPLDQDLINQLLPPAWIEGGNPDYLLGTDGLGRDRLSRLLYGARVALYVAVLAAAGAALLGTVLALVGGYFGGWIDWAVSRAVDVWQAIPPVVLALILMVAFGAGLNNVVLAIIVVDWTRFCRVIRADVLNVMQQNYVASARMAGFTHRMTILREVLPAIVPLLLTMLSLEMGIAVVVEAILSFVGMSVEANVSAWGVMIADARADLNQAPFGLFLPVLAILITVLGFNLLGDGLRRALDPRLRTSRTEAA